MQECYQVVFPGQAPIQKKGHIEPIDISVASRGSNKKVTAPVTVCKITVDKRGHSVIYESPMGSGYF